MGGGGTMRGNGGRYDGGMGGIFHHIMHVRTSPTVWSYRGILVTSTRHRHNPSFFCPGGGVGARSILFSCIVRSPAPRPAHEGNVMH